MDIRTTENLHLMRETSVYLMAEEAGNRTRLQRGQCLRSKRCALHGGRREEVEGARAVPRPQGVGDNGTGAAFCGLAIEVGKKESHGSFEAFEKAAKSAKVDVPELDKGIARY